MQSKLLHILEIDAITKELRVHPITGGKLDFSKIWIFALKCGTYKYDRKKLGPKDLNGVFVAYDKKSPAFLVYSPNAGNIDQGTQTRVPRLDIGFRVFLQA